MYLHANDHFEVIFR